MEAKTSTASAIDVTQAQEEYDASCKRLLSEKSILAWILKSLRKVYSIWVCLHPPVGRSNTITRYYMAEENLVGENHEPVESYDLISMVLIYVGRESDQQGEPDEKYSGVLKLLGTLFTSGASAEEKKQILKEEYQIPMTQTIAEEVSKMYPFSQYIAITNYQEGESAGFQKTKASDIRLLMKNIGLPFEKAAAALELPREEWSQYAKLIEQPSGRSVPG